MSLMYVCRLFMVLSGTALHQKLSFSEVPTCFIYLLQPSFQLIALWDTSKDKDVGDRMSLSDLVLTEPFYWPLQLVSQPGFGICASHHLPIIQLSWQTHAAWGGACGSPCFLLGWVGNAKHTSFKVHQELVADRPALKLQCACCGWPCYFGEVQVWQLLVVSTEQSSTSSFCIEWIL